MSDSVVVVQTPFSKSVAIDGSRRLHVEATFDPNAATTDAFGRLRVSDPATIFDAKMLYDQQPLLFNNNLTGTGGVTYQVNRSSLEMTSGTGTGIGNRAIHQTRRYFNYQPGKSQLIFATFNAYGAEAGCQKKVGYFDDNNGIFLRVDGDGTVNVVRRSSTTGSPQDEVVPQASWNRDPLNGNGPSGITLDLTKVQILVIDMEWLGVGVVRVGFDINGQVTYVHDFRHANILTTVYMKTPNLPVRWEIQNTGTPGSAPMLDAICCSVQSEGGANPLSTKRSVDRGITPITNVSTTLVPVLSLRLRSAANRATVFPNLFSIFAGSAGDFRWAVMLFPRGTGLGASTVWTAVTNSAVEYNTDRTSITTPSNGIVINSGYGSNTNQSTSVLTENGLQSVLALGTDVDGVTDELVLAVQTLSSTNSFFGSLGWIELL